MKKRFIPIIIAAAMLCGCSTSGGNASSAPSAAESSSAVSAAASQEASKTESKAESSEAEAASSAGEAAASSSEAAPAESKQEEVSSKADEEPASSCAESEAQSSEAEEGSSEVSEDPYEGTYVEDIAHRGVITITKVDDFLYSVSVRWPGSAYETANWELSGEFSGRAVLRYDNCKKTVTTYSEDGSYTDEVIYENGTGYLQMGNRSADEITVNWVDDMENIADGTVFVKQ